MPAELTEQRGVRDRSCADGALEQMREAGATGGAIHGPVPTEPWRRRGVRDCSRADGAHSQEYTGSRNGQAERVAAFRVALLLLGSSLLWLLGRSLQGLHTGVVTGATACRPLSTDSNGEP